MKKFGFIVVLVLLCIFLHYSRIDYVIFSSIDRNAIYVLKNTKGSCEQWEVELCSNEKYVYYGTNGCVPNYKVIYHGKKYSVQEVLSQQILTTDQLNDALYKGNGSFVYSKAK